MFKIKENIIHFRLPIAYSVSFNLLSLSAICTFYWTLFFIFGCVTFLIDLSKPCSLIRIQLAAQILGHKRSGFGQFLKSPFRYPWLDPSTTILLLSYCNSGCCCCTLSSNLKSSCFTLIIYDVGWGFSITYYLLSDAVNTTDS